MFYFIAFLLYFLIDVHYFLRVIQTYIIGRFFRKNLKSILDGSDVYGICLPSDADFMLTHMNNSRFLREYDFARFDFATRNGTLDYIMKKGGSFPVAALTIRYRLPLYLFSFYKVTTTPLWWDSKNLYLDQRITTVFDGIVRSVGFTKLGIVGVDFEKVVKDIFGDVKKKPEISNELKTWIQANDLSSQNMKKKE